MKAKLTKGAITLLLSVITFVQISGQVNIILKVPANTPYSGNIYISGSFNNWNPADDSYAMKRNANGTYIFYFPGLLGSVHYKFTRGSWESVEVADGGGEIKNRKLEFGVATTLNLEVAQWKDLGNAAPPKHTAQKNVVIVQEEFKIPQLNRTRKIWIYLPPDYATSKTKYPVLYMHDAQNLFDSYYSFAGEWEIDEAMNKIFEATKKGIIIVAIDHGGNNRLKELTPWKNAKYENSGDGDKYAKFIVETLKPYIDSKYRTLPTRENTGVMGSSLGGLMSFYLGVKYQNIFGKVGVFSPSFWFSDSSYILPAHVQKKFTTKMYLLAGGKESKDRNVINETKKMMDALLAKGYKEDEIKFVPKEDGQHNETFWKREFPDAIVWLFGLQTTATIKPK